MALIALVDIGDWEHLTVRTVNGVALSADYRSHVHSGSGNIPYSQVPKFDDDRPVSYVAKGSHGAWATPGTFTYVNAVVFKLQDETSDGGVYWNTQDALVMYEYPDTYTGEDSWLNFLGNWGNEGTNDCWWYAFHPQCDITSGWPGLVRQDTLGVAKRKRSLSAGPVDNRYMDSPLSVDLELLVLGVIWLILSLAHARVSLDWKLILHYSPRCVWYAEGLIRTSMRLFEL